MVDDMATQIVEYIWTTERRGRGTPDDLARVVYQLWTKSGVLVAEHDQLGGSFFQPFGPELGLTGAQKTANE